MGLWNTVTSFVEDAVDFGSDFFGGSDILDLPDELQYTQGMSGSSFIGSVVDYGSSFLGGDLGSLIKTGASMYLKSQEKPTFTNPQFQRPDIIRGRMQPSQVTPSQVRNPVGLNNAQVQSAMRRMSQRTNTSPQLQRIVDANMTARQGRRTIGLGSTGMPRVAPVAPAAVRKTTATTEVS